MLKIVVYSCNFGNYRNELNNFNNLILDTKIDYYIYTNNQTFQI